MPELRNSGIKALGKIPWGSHFCHFYETKNDLLDIVVPYFKTGLENKEFCLWILSKSGLITIEEAKLALKKVVPGIEQHISNKDIEIHYENDWYLEERGINLKKTMNSWHAKLKEALALGYVGMRASGDTFWLSENNWSGFHEYEKQVTESIISTPMTILCTYPIAKSGAAEVLDVTHSHQFAIARRLGKWEVIETANEIQAQTEITRLSKVLDDTIYGNSKHPYILSYGMAVLSVVIATLILGWMQASLVDAPYVSVFLCAVLYSTWLGGSKPGLLAFILCFLSFDYYFLPPMFSLSIQSSQFPRLLLFTGLALFIIWLTVNQRNLTQSLRHARKVLEGIVQKQRDTNAMLQAEITERKKSELQIIEEKEQIRRLTEHLQKIREEERIYMAREIHDELGQQLTAIKMDVAWIDKKTSIEAIDIKRKLKNIIELLDGSNQSIRRMLSELRPQVLDDQSLFEAIKWLGRQFTENTGIPVKFTVPQRDVKVSEQIAICIFRVCQEAFTNITRYSRAKNVSIVVKIGQENIVIIIEDDGVGFNAASVQTTKSFGILGMKERVLSLGGSFELVTFPGKGTKIIVTLPFAEM